MDGSAAAGLPGWEMGAYLCLTVGSHLYSFYEVHRVSQSKSALFLPPRPKAAVLWLAVSWQRESNRQRAARAAGAAALSMLKVCA